MYKKEEGLKTGYLSIQRVLKLWTLKVNGNRLALVLLSSKRKD